MISKKKNRGTKLAARRAIRNSKRTTQKKKPRAKKSAKKRLTRASGRGAALARRTRKFLQGLSAHAQAGFDALVQEFSNKIVLSSGRRTVAEQASAMAGNVVSNRQWIKQTYAQSAERDSLQKWVDDHADANTKEKIAAGLKSIMDTWTDAQLRILTYHVTGDAFDIKPVSGDDAEKIKSSIRRLEHLRKFLEQEGGKTIWHLEFN